MGRAGAKAQDLAKARNTGFPQRNHRADAGADKALCPSILTAIKEPD